MPSSRPPIGTRNARCATPSGSASTLRRMGICKRMIVPLSSAEAVVPASSMSACSASRRGPIRSTSRRASTSASCPSVTGSRSTRPCTMGGSASSMCLVVLTRGAVFAMGSRKQVKPPSGRSCRRTMAKRRAGSLRSSVRFHGRTSSYLLAKKRCSTGWSAACSSPRALFSSHHWMRRRNASGVQVRITAPAGSKYRHRLAGVPGTPWF